MRPRIGVRGVGGDSEPTGSSAGRPGAFGSSAGISEQDDSLDLTLFGDGGLVGGPKGWRRRHEQHLGEANGVARAVPGVFGVGHDLWGGFSNVASARRGDFQFRRGAFDLRGGARGAFVYRGRGGSTLAGGHTVGPGHSSPVRLG
jgi:hypothetical protein